MLCFSLADISREMLYLSGRVTRPVGKPQDRTRSEIALFEAKNYRQRLTDRALRLQGPTLPNTLPITDINSGLTGTTSYQRGSAIKRFNGIGGDGSFTSDKYPGLPKPMTIDETIVKKPMRSRPVPPPPPPPPKMLATIRVRMKNGKIITQQRKINTVENVVKSKPVGSNIASDLKNRPGAAATLENKAKTAVESLGTTARRGGGGAKAAAIALGLVASAGGIGYLVNRNHK